MDWFNVWSGLKNKICRYLLQRYLGQFLEEKLNLEQLKVDLFNGKATVRDVTLKVEAINELFEAQGWDLEAIEGHIGLLTVTVPWNALMTNDSSIEVSDVFISLRPVRRHNDGTSMLESMWSSVSSTMQLAEECMKQNDDESSDDVSKVNTSSIAGLETFAETIDNVLNRIRATFTNVILKLEYPSKDNSRGIALYIDISNFTYKNETGCEKNVKTDNNQSDKRADKKEGCNKQSYSNDSYESIYLMPMFAKHNIILTGLCMYTEEYRIGPGSVRGIECCSISQCNSNRIPILEIKEQQNIQIKMKQSENIPGPKVSLNGEIGAIYLFLTPRQTYLIVQFWNAFQEDDLKHNSGQENKNYMPVEKMHGIMVKPGNWNTYEETAVPRLASKNLHSEFDGKSTLYCDSINNSISSSSTLTESSKFYRKLPSTDTCGEILNFSIKISSFVGVILQEDILVESSISATHNTLNEKSQEDLINMAKKFFACAENIFKGNITTALSSIKNHLCLRILPLFIEGVQQRNKNVLSSRTKITATELDLYETLDDTISSLIIFDRTENLCDGYPKRPDVVFSMKATSSSKFKDVFNTFEVTLEQCIVEVDISIYDRLSCLLGPSPFVDFASSYPLGKDPRSSYSRQQEMSLIDINTTCAMLGIKLRFPIFDARPIHDPNRVPWWKKNVRMDFLYITFSQFYAKCVPTVAEITANEINLFYCENEANMKILLMKTNLARDATANSASAQFQYPKITLSVPSNKSIETFLKHYCDENGHAEVFNISEDETPYGLPFSSKRVCRESDTIHNKRDTAESETIFLPGDTEEINKFCDLTRKASKVQIQIHLPVVEVVVESKCLYEIIYNRLNGDIFMWEPSSPILQNASKLNSDVEQSFRNIGLMDSIYVSADSVQKTHEESVNFKDKYCDTQPEDERADNGLLLSGSENSDEGINYEIGSGVNSIYLSIHDNGQPHVNTKQPKLRPSISSIEITIGEGSLVFYVPVRDSGNHILPGQFGKFDFKVNNLKICSVNGYNGNKNLCYLCLQLSDIEMYHCGIIPGGSSIVSERNANWEGFMQSTIYKTPNGLIKGAGVGIKEREMVSLIIEIRKNPEQRIKRLKITAGIQQMTLRYHPALSDLFWLNQLIDFLDVLDFPIEGYEPLGVITEIQMHLWDCAVDYRPRNIGFRAVIEIGSFTIGSNIISSVSGCNLRLIIEEGILSLAPFDNLSNVFPDCKITCINSKNLVPVFDIGLLDISLRLTGDIVSDKCPKFDLRCSVHDAHLRTCSDSGSALAQLISYIANDGDFSAYNTDEISTISSESSVNSDAEIFSTRADKLCPDISAQQQERINLLVAQAVEDTVTSIDISSNSYAEYQHKERGVEVFYFPDESKKLLAETEDNSMATELSEILNFESSVMKASLSAGSGEEALPQIKNELGDINQKRKNRERKLVSHEEEYCVIADDEKNFLSQCGIKNVEISNEPLRIVDNHFHLPSNKPDLLRCPENFPMAVSRYTLCEMTFTWHLYGGNDFLDALPTSANTEIKTESSRMSDAYKQGVSYSKGSRSIKSGKKIKEQLTWKSEGGPQRNHEILVEIQFTKVRFSHEVYPVHTSQASRQVLLISEIEIRDRLQSSDIKKFLYYPNARNLCNLSSQHMVIIKALNIRPNPNQSTAQECSLRISLSPMRLNIDQDTLLFLADYFTNIGESNTEKCCSENDSKPNKMNYDQHAPIMTVDEIPEAVQDLSARRMISTNIDLLMDKGRNDTTNTSSCPTQAKEEVSPIYFREVIFSPEVKIRFDYHGRRVELSRGPIAGLLMGLGQLQCSEIRLRKIVYRRGLLGIDKLLTFLCKEWLRDIKKNQLPKILSGVGPAYALVQFFQGIYDLFWLPIEQYQKDGRIFRGLQLGAQSFTARTALAALEITSRIIQLLQFTAETAFDMVSPGPPIRRIKKMRKYRKKRLHRPKDIREGVTNAYLIFKEGINDSANTLIETAVAEHDQKGYTGAVGAVIRHIPPIICQPAVWTTQATTNILGGVKSSLVPEAKMEAREKWKDESD